MTTPEITLAMVQKMCLQSDLQIAKLVTQSEFFSFATPTPETVIPYFGKEQFLSIFTVRLENLQEKNIKTILGLVETLDAVRKSNYGRFRMKTFYGNGSLCNFIIGEGLDLVGIIFHIVAKEPTQSDEEVFFTPS